MTPGSGLSLTDPRHPLEGVEPIVGLTPVTTGRRGIVYGEPPPEGALGQIAPATWLVEHSDHDVDLGHGLVTVRVERRLLAATITLDVSVDALPEGSITVTGLGGVPVILHGRSGDELEVDLPRSMARSVWGWLASAAGDHAG